MAKGIFGIYFDLIIFIDKSLIMACLAKSEQI